jgi:hypothetical protein
MPREPVAHLIEREHRPDIRIERFAPDATEPRIFAEQNVAHSRDEKLIGGPVLFDEVDPDGVRPT